MEIDLSPLVLQCKQFFLPYKYVLDSKPWCQLTSSTVLWTAAWVRGQGTRSGLQVGQQWSLSWLPLLVLTNRVTPKHCVKWESRIINGFQFFFKAMKPFI